MSLSPWVAEAAGLGKLTVLSGLGQPLRAELDIGATKDELAGMAARLAPQDAFRQAGVDFASVLLDLRFAVEKRPNGQAVVKVTSVKPINEPFLDFLVELNWPSGRLVREYTFLLDPPEIAAQQASRPVAEARIVETVRGGGAAPEERTSAASRAAARPAPMPKVAAEPKQKPESTGTRVVARGETLRKIADETKPEGVSLEQMLVGLFQANPDAFIGNNLHRMKSGAILNIPEKTAVESVSASEAKKIYVAQTGDWNAYRQKLAAATAGTPAKPEAAAAQESAGKITAKVEEKATPAEQGKDQVKVARTDVPAKGAAPGKSAAEVADQIAKDKALKEAQDRMAVLEKNVNELQKLLEMKNQKLAELQQPPAKKEEPKKPAEAVKPVEPPKPAEVQKPVEPPKPVEAPKPPPKVEEAPKPVETPKVEAPKPVEPPKVEVPKVEAPKPVEVKPAEAPKPAEKPKLATPAPAPAEEPGLVDSLLADPLPLAGGGLLALLAGYFLMKRRRTSSTSVETTAVPVPSSLGPNSVFRMTGGQSIDTGNTPPQTGDFSQTGPGTIDTDEVDPVAEADVYMAYGRDTQAEEILLEALQKDQHRTAIHAKLLEIYANRRSMKQFETLASELYAQTGGVGQDWEKVALLGLALDPNNPLYSGASGKSAPAMAEPEVAPVIPEPEPIAEPEPEPVDDVSEDFERDTMVLAPESEAQPEAVADVPEVASDAMTLDFDLGAETVAPGMMQDESSAEPPPVDADATLDAGALDFDLGGEFSAAEPVAAVIEAPPVEEPTEVIDFDLPVGEESLLAEATGSSPDFSPEGTLVMSSPTAVSGMDVGLGTWVGGDNAPGAMAEEAGSLREPAADLGDDMAPSMTQTVVNPLAGTDTLVSADILSFGDEDNNPKLAETMVNTAHVDTDSLEFDVKLTDSMFLGQPMVPPEFDIGSINLDLAAEPAPAQVATSEAAPTTTVEKAMDHVEAEAAAVAEPQQDGNWEEVNTKLDLAKAYEEMGDLEGARELLQEVVGEGPADLVEQARTILGRIGG
jgi:pilus assembly protein FimV